MKKNRGVKLLIIFAMFVMAICSCFGIGNTAFAAEKWGALQGTIHLSKGTINGDVISEDGSIIIDGATINGSVQLMGASSQSLTFTSGKIQNSNKVGLNPGRLSTITINGGSIINNKSNSGNGGGIYLAGAESAVDFRSGTISGNSSYYDGGGVYVDDDATFRMYGGEISGNCAGDGSCNGGGICITSGYVEIYGGRIVDNEGGYGSAIWNEGDLELRGGVIHGEIANSSGNINYFDCDFDDNGFILTGGGSINICQRPTKTIRISVYTFSEGAVVATVKYGSSSQDMQDVIDHLEITNMLEGFYLAASGSNIVLKRQMLTVRLTSNYGTVSPSSITVPYGTTYTLTNAKTTAASNSKTTATLKTSDGQTITATCTNTSTYVYRFSSWTSLASGSRITSNVSGSVSFTRYDAITLTFSVSPAGTATIGLALGAHYFPKGVKLTAPYMSGSSLGTGYHWGIEGTTYFIRPSSGYAYSSSDMRFSGSTNVNSSTSITIYTKKSSFLPDSDYAGKPNLKFADDYPKTSPRADYIFAPNDKFKVKPAKDNIK